MSDPAAATPALNQDNLQNPSSPASGLVVNTQDEIQKLLVAVEKFRKTGSVTESEVTFAKNQVLPKLGYSKEQIDDLGPVGIMIKLQEEADKKHLVSSSSPLSIKNQAPITASESAKPNLVNKPEPEKKLNPTQIASEATNDDFNELTKQVSQMSDKLSSDIDNEIRRQLEEKKALEQTQAKVDKVLKEHEEVSLPRSNESPEDQKPNIGLFRTINDQKKEPKIIHEPIYPTKQSDSEETTTATDPLSASVEFALESLKEGDSIGSEWTLKKILTTSFGNRKSPFYELLNKSGAAWTLSPEEMKDVIRSNILSTTNTPVKEIKGDKQLPDLSPKIKIVPEKPETKPTVEPKIKLAEEVKPEPKEMLASEAYIARPLEPEKKFETPKTEVKQTQKPDFRPEVKDQSENNKPLAETPDKPKENLVFNQKQVSFLNKIHSDPSMWDTFTTFDPKLWEEFNSLYEKGELVKIGIDAHPLFDRLNSAEYGTQKDIQKGDNIGKLLSEAGYNLSWTADDAIIFAVHLIANYKILTDALKKLELTGLTTHPLPPQKEIISLTAAALNGNHESFHKLEEAFSFLPIGNKFKFIKPDLLDQLSKYFKT